MTEQTLAEKLRILADAAEPQYFDECVATGQSCVYGPHGMHGEQQCKYCGKEPQAQAGEPEVVATVVIAPKDLSPFNSLIKPALPYGEKLITLQAHREAVHKLQVEITNRGDWLVEWNKCKEELAKKDAALKACVEAAIAAANYIDTLGGDSRGLRAAITQAQEQLK